MNDYQDMMAAMRNASAKSIDFVQDQVRWALDALFSGEPVEDEDGQFIGPIATDVQLSSMGLEAGAD